MNLIFNPKYQLKKDKGAVILLPKNIYNIERDKNIKTGSINFIHSIHAAILTFFDGRPTNMAIRDAASFLSVEISIISNFINKITENKTDIYVKFKGILIIFPINTLIYSNETLLTKYDPKTFDYEETSISVKRHLTPTDITLMFNTKCLTDCIYCYADRRIKMNCHIPLKRIIELISEAKSFGARSFQVIGGEFFLYKEWKNVIACLLDHEFHPYISTKVPIGEKIVKDLSNLKIKYIQISLDSFKQESLEAILNVKSNYRNLMKSTFTLLQKYNIKILVHTVMNKFNENIEDIDSLFSFLKQFDNIVYWRLDKAGASLYKGTSLNNFTQFKPNNDKLGEIIKYINYKEYKNKCSFSIIYEGIITPERNSEQMEARKWNSFENRSMCTANVSNLFILPDGEVTICEELYWTPRFIIGNVLKNSLVEIWNSERALNLYNVSQNEFPENSPCKYCKLFHSCRKGKGVCHRDILKAYGLDKWYYPDRKCPKAIKDKYEVYI